MMLAEGKSMKEMNRIQSIIFFFDFCKIKEDVDSGCGSKTALSLHFEVSGIPK